MKFKEAILSVANKMMCLDGKHCPQVDARFGIHGVNLHAEAARPTWRLYTSDAFTNVANWDEAGLPAHDLWKIYVVIVATAFGDLFLRINNDAGNNYEYVYTTLATLARQQNQPRMMIATQHNLGPTMAEIMIGGRSLGIQNDIQVTMNAASYLPYLGNQVLVGRYYALADVNQLTIIPGAGNITGNVKLFWMDW